MALKTVVDDLRHITHDFAPKIEQIAEAEFSAKPSPTKWSKKEVLGHLIDSAQNNLRRFIIGQYEKTPPKITYDQDFWVIANGYQQVSKADVLQLWKLINGQICEVLSSIPAEKNTFTCDTGKESFQPVTLEWLAVDYVKHLKHHLNQILPGSFAITYP